MADPQLDDLVVLLPPLLRSLESLAFIGRHMHPPDLAEVVAAAGRPDIPLREARPRLDAWPDPLAGVRERLAAASDAVLAAFDGLGAAAANDETIDLRAVSLALRNAPRAQEQLYPLASALPPISRFFLDTAVRDDAGLLASLADAPDDASTGIFQIDNEPGQRGGYSLYVPEYYSPDRAWPVVFALHGGGGIGRAFLWNWLRDARSFGAILVSPTSIGPTWALNGPDPDSPNFARILADLDARYAIDPSRLLLTGMSDGGTFAYVSGLEPTSPFTHLAPAEAAFHPMLAAMADPERLSGLPIHITHGALDWMFPIDMAREAEAMLRTAGADVTYLEIEDLSHCYPREINPAVLRWMGVI